MKRNKCLLGILTLSLLGLMLFNVLFCSAYNVYTTHSVLSYNWITYIYFMNFSVIDIFITIAGGLVIGKLAISMAKSKQKKEWIKIHCQKLLTF